MLAQLNAQQLDTAELCRVGALLDGSGNSLVLQLAEEWLRVRTRGGSLAPLVPNPVQQMFEQRRGRRNIVLKARQLGLTTWTAARFFLKTITRPGTLTLQVAHTQQAAEQIFRIVHRFYDWLPEALREGPLANTRANVRQMVFEDIDSEYRVVTAGDRNAGRGLTVQNLHCSELARWPGDPADILAGLRAALAPDAEEILESTPQGAAGCFYEEWRSAEETSMVRHFFPWWMEPGYRAKTPADAASITEEERALMDQQRLDLHQIEFRRGVRSTFRKLVRQEYAEDAESCFLASGESVFELSAVEARLTEAPPPAETRKNGALEIWFPPIVGKHYLVAADPAGGGSEGDYSAAQVIDRETGLQCAEYSAHLGVSEFARLLSELAAEYNNALVVVKRNNHGAAVLAHLETTFRYENLYRSNGQPGWLTTSVTRPAALGRLDAALVDAPHLFMSRKLLAECRSFVRQANGNAAAQAGAHDDRVMAMAIALAAREQSAASLLSGTVRRPG